MTKFDIFLHDGSKRLHERASSLEMINAYIGSDWHPGSGRGVLAHSLEAHFAANGDVLRHLHEIEVDRMFDSKNSFSHCELYIRVRDEFHVVEFCLKYGGLWGEG